MRRILELIRDHDGKWSWYQIERALWGTDLSRSGEVFPTLQDLESKGLVRTKEVEGYPNPLYSITPLGIEFLDEGTR